MTAVNRFAAFFVAVLLASLIGCTSTEKQESAGEYIDDTVITTKVKTAILKDEDLDVTEINVETFKGVVQLSGFVESAEDKRKAVEVARGVKGVKSVEDSMQVKGE